MFFFGVRPYLWIDRILWKRVRACLCVSHRFLHWRIFFCEIKSGQFRNKVFLLCGQIAYELYEIDFVIFGTRFCALNGWKSIVCFFFVNLSVISGQREKWKTNQWKSKSYKKRAGVEISNTTNFGSIGIVRNCNWCMCSASAGGKWCKCWCGCCCICGMEIDGCKGQTCNLWMNCETATAMWMTLKSVYEQSSKANLLHLQQRYYGSTKNPAEDISTFMSKLQTIVQQMKDLGETISEPMIIAKVLMTLTEEYRHFSSAWESTPEADQCLENLKTRLMMEEIRIKGRAGNENVDAFVAGKTFLNEKGSKKGDQPLHQGERK